MCQVVISLHDDIHNHKGCSFSNIENFPWAFSVSLYEYKETLVVHLTKFDCKQMGSFIHIICVFLVLAPCLEQNVSEKTI